jgi:hypothetical protein
MIPYKKKHNCISLGISVLNLMHTFLPINGISLYINRIIFYSVAGFFWAIHTTY